MKRIILLLACISLQLCAADTPFSEEEFLSSLTPEQRTPESRILFDLNYSLEPLQLQHAKIVACLQNNIGTCYRDPASNETALMRITWLATYQQGSFSRDFPFDIFIRSFNHLINHHRNIVFQVSTSNQDIFYNLIDTIIDRTHDLAAKSFVTNSFGFEKMTEPRIRKYDQFLSQLYPWLASPTTQYVFKEIIAQAAADNRYHIHQLLGGPALGLYNVLQHIEYTTATHIATGLPTAAPLARKVIKKLLTLILTNDAVPLHAYAPHLQEAAKIVNGEYTNGFHSQVIRDREDDPDVQRRLKEMYHRCAISEFGIMFPERYEKSLLHFMLMHKPELLWLKKNETDEKSIIETDVTHSLLRKFIHESATCQKSPINKTIDTLHAKKISLLKATITREISGPAFMRNPRKMVPQYSSVKTIQQINAEKIIEEQQLLDGFLDTTIHIPTCDETQLRQLVSNCTIL